MHPALCYISPLFTLLISPVFPLLGSPSFVRIFNTQNNDAQPLSIELPSGDLVLIGRATFPDYSKGEAHTQISKIIVYCLDNRGVVKWNKNIGSSDHKFHYALAQSDGNIGILSEAFSGVEEPGIQLIVLDGIKGTIRLSKVYYFDGISTAKSNLVGTKDGGFVIAGTAPTPLNLYLKALIFKVDEFGNYVWGYMSNQINQFAHNAELMLTPNGDIIFGGRVDKPQSNFEDTFLLKVSNNGTLQGLQTYGFINSDLASYHFAQTTDGYVFAASVSILEADYIVTTKVSKTGNVLYSKKFNVFEESVRELVVDAQNNVILLTYSQSASNSYPTLTLTKLTSTLEIEARRTFRVANSDDSYSLVALSDGGYLLSAVTTNEIRYDSFIYLAKFQPDFKVCGSLIEVTDIQERVVSEADVQSTPQTAAQYFFQAFLYLQEFYADAELDTFTYETLRQNEQQCELYDASYSSTDNSSDNKCGCAVNGICDSETLLCTCESGYSGEKCQYEETELDQFREATTIAISSFKGNYQSLERKEALAQASYLSATPDFITTDSFLELSSIVLALAVDQNGPVAQQTIQSAMEVQSKLSQINPTSQEEKLQVTKQITTSTTQMIEANIDSNLIIETDSIKLKVEAIDASQRTTVAPSTSVAAQIPAGVSQCVGASKLAAVAYGALSYAGLTTENEAKESPVFSVDLYCDGAKQTVQNLQTPIKLQFKVTTSRGLQILNQVADRTLAEDVAISSGFFQCRFYDETTNTLSSEGCEVTRLTETSFICECTHLTNFLSFFNKGAEVLQQSNYAVWLALPQVTLQSLTTNIGFYIACSYWFLLFILGLMACNADRIHLRGKKRMKLLYEQSHPHSLNETQFEEAQDSDASVYPVENFNDKGTERRKSINVISEVKGRRSDPDNRRKSIREIRHLDNSIVIDEAIDVQKRRSTLTKRVSLNEKKLPPLFTLAKEKKKRPGACLRAKQRVQKQLEEKASAYKHRCCCCVCCGMAKREIGEKNMVLSLCGKTSPLYSRCVRLSVLLLGVLTDVAMCALFFNLEPIEDSFQFWESLVENVWVGLYSVLLSVPPMVVVVLAFRIPSSVTRSFEESTSLAQLESEYKRHSSRLSCHKCLGFTLFFLLSCVLCLYLVAFGHVVSITLQKNWVQSSGASLAIDLVAFELMPALFFGAVGLLIFVCDCKCCLCALVSLDLYRVFRNVAA